MRFLIIDEDAGYRQILRYHLEVEWPGAIIDEHAPRGMVELPDSYRLTDYDLILRGHPLTSEHGLGGLERLVRRSGCPPVVLLAESSDPLFAVDALKAGAASYFPKAAVTHRRLVRVVRDEIGASRAPAPDPALIAKPAWVASSYRFMRTLHSTDVACVYLAESSGSAEKLAFKVIRSVPDAGGGQVFERFLQEYEVIAGLEHPNVVRIRDLGIADDHAYIAMEYLAAGTLAERLSGALPPEQALSYVRQVGEALAAVHDAGILHRDLKPANIMFREDDTLALIDFGLAKRMRLEASLTGTGEIFGTPYYMSPEQGHADATDERSDLYSLGCIFYEMLTGRRPFVGGTAMGVIYKHARSPRPRVGAELEHFQGPIERMMAIEPARRYASAREMLADLERFAP